MLTNRRVSVPIIFPVRMGSSFDTVTCGGGGRRSCVSVSWRSPPLKTESTLVSTFKTPIVSRHFLKNATQNGNMTFFSDKITRIWLFVDLASMADKKQF